MKKLITLIAFFGMLYTVQGQRNELSAEAQKDYKREWRAVYSSVHAQHTDYTKAGADGFYSLTKKGEEELRRRWLDLSNGYTEQTYLNKKAKWDAQKELNNRCAHTIKFVEPWIGSDYWGVFDASGNEIGKANTLKEAKRIKSYFTRECKK